MPLIKRDSTPSFEKIFINKNIIKPLPSPSKTFSPEPGIDQNDFLNILKIIKHAGTSFEKTPRTFSTFNEESLRDVILSNINSIYEGEAKGEVFNKSGKTDIYLSNDGRNAFIAECKIWKGKKTLLEALDQLLSYLTWRDCKTLLVFFNKTNKSFTDILNTIPDTIKKHPNFIFYDNQYDSNEWHFTIKSKEDVNQYIQLRVMCFDLYVKSFERDQSCAS